MFEIGFQEIVVIALLALIVLGPEKLPKLAAKIGHWTGKARGMARNLRQQLENEVSYEELVKQKEMAEEALRTAQVAPMKFHDDLDAQIKSATADAEDALMPRSDTSVDNAAAPATPTPVADATPAAITESQDPNQPTPIKDAAGPA